MSAPDGLAIAAIAAPLIAAIFFLAAFRRARKLRRSGARPHSKPVYHGLFVMLCALVPATGAFVIASLAATPLTTRALDAALPEVTDAALGAITQSDIRRPILVRRMIDEWRAAAEETPERLSEPLRRAAAPTDGSAGVRARDALLDALKTAPERPARTRELLALLKDRDPLRYERVLSDARALALGDRPSVRNDPVRQAAGERYRARRATFRVAGGLAVILAALIGGGIGVRRLSPGLRARPAVEGTVRLALIVCSSAAILATIGIVFSLAASALRFFIEDVPPWEFFFGLHWSPLNLPDGADPAGSGVFGAVPLFTGTLLITLIAVLIAGPLGLSSAIFLSEYADRRVRDVVKPLLEILAGVPTVVYGFFALLAIGPGIRAGVEEFALLTGLPIDVSTKSALSAGLIMGVMIIPYMSSIADDVISAVPRSLRDGAYGMGATRSETIMKVVLPAALPGVIAALLLAVSRAIGETMIVVMAVGRSANLTGNPLDLVTTVTVQIVALLTGDNEFDTAATRSAFALGLTLFLVTLALNVVALRIVRAYREKYD